VAVNGNDIAQWATQYVGTPYVWGGNSLTGGVDCSGLVQQVYKHFGINVSRTTYSQIGEGKSIDMHGLRAGDMVFFDTNPSVSGPDHVGLYIGGGKMIEAPRPGKNVQITDITSGYYQNSFMGGRRVQQITGGGPDEQWAPGDTSKAAVKLSPEELAASYGWAYGFLNSRPDLKGLFAEAVKDSWSADKFSAKLRDTKWFKETAATARQAQVQKATDPATYNASIAAAKLQVQNLAAEMGAAIPSSKLNSIAESIVATGMDEQSMRNVIGGYISFTDKGTLNGQAGMYAHTIKEYAFQQGVTMDDQSVKNQAAMIGRGLATEQDFKDQIKTQAASMYPGYTDQLNAGQTMMDLASPYIQQMSNDLEVPYTGLNLSDPLIKQALNGVNKDGKPTGVDTQTFQSLIRNDPRWTKTTNAQNKVMQSGLKVLQDMGIKK